MRERLTSRSNTFKPAPQFYETKKLHWDGTRRHNGIFFPDAEMNRLDMVRGLQFFSVYFDYCSTAEICTPHRKKNESK
jgi:hypothetical protein